MTGMLKRKVIVVSGVGPGLGTTLAHRCARDGADLVLAARSAERLDDVAKQITPGDGRWRCAPTSPTTTT
ncbi:oxidoreductase [Mycobacterium tuberculosis]|nr:oxidoreductase [Mycobacterium tuberculosis]